MFPVDHSILAPSAGRVDPEAAPARPAVVLLCDATGIPILLATTADARAFLRKRLGPGPDAPRADVPSGDAALPEVIGARTLRLAPRTDLSSIVARADLTLVGSGFEADLAFLEVARRAMPATWEALTERWRGWFIHLDPEVPGWRKTNLGDAASGTMPAEIQHLIGPVNSKNLASKLGEIIDDAFDLCRYPRELALAPRGTACAYKEMGRCPAPCDGSEPIDSYRSRVRGALDELRLDPACRGSAWQHDMQRAAGAQDYRVAADLKGRLDRLDALGKPALREARPMDTLRFVAIYGAGRAGWARAWWIDPWTCHPLGDFSGADLNASATNLHRLVTEHGRDLDARLPGLLARGVDPTLVGIVARHLVRKRSVRSVGLLRSPRAGSPSDEPARLHAAYRKFIAAAARVEQTDVEEFDRATLA